MWSSRVSYGKTVSFWFGKAQSTIRMGVLGALAVGLTLVAGSAVAQTGGEGGIHHFMEHLARPMAACT